MPSSSEQQKQMHDATLRSLEQFMSIKADKYGSTPPIQHDIPPPPPQEASKASEDADTDASTPPPTQQATASPPSLEEELARERAYLTALLDAKPVEYRIYIEGAKRSKRDQAIHEVLEYIREIERKLLEGEGKGKEELGKGSGGERKGVEGKGKGKEKGDVEEEPKGKGKDGGYSMTEGEIIQLESGSDGPESERESDYGREDQSDQMREDPREAQRQSRARIAIDDIRDMDALEAEFLASHQQQGGNGGG